MDYMNTLEDLEKFSNAFARKYEHPVGALAILYHLVQIRGFWEFLLVVNKTPCSLSVNY